MSTITISRAPSRPRATARPMPVRPTPARGASVREGRVRPTPSSAAPLRLTRRGRVVAVLLLAVVIFGAFTALGSRSAATGEAGVPVQTRAVEVGPGDTLWGIASEVAAPGQVRETVQRIEQLNALPGPALVVGQEIAVPVG